MCLQIFSAIIEFWGDSPFEEPWFYFLHSSQIFAYFSHLDQFSTLGFKMADWRNLFININTNQTALHDWKQTVQLDLLREKGKINLLVKSEERLDHQTGKEMWHIWALRSPGTRNSNAPELTLHFFFRRYLERVISSLINHIVLTEFANKEAKISGFKWLPKFTQLIIIAQWDMKLSHSESRAWTQKLYSLNAPISAPQLLSNMPEFNLFYQS